MKTEFYLFVPALAMLCACSSAKLAAPDSLAGTWNVVEASGNKITAGDPYIGFDMAEGRVYGSAGCNNIMGAFDPNTKAGSLSLDKLGSTRMMCADMSTENMVLSSLSEVESFRKKGNDGIELTNGNGDVVALLHRRSKAVKSGELNGDWKIVSVFGMDVPSDLEPKPVISFDVSRRLVSGNDGCNSFSGEMNAGDGMLLFSSVATTLMACPDNAIEGQVLKALNEVERFGMLPSGNMGLFDRNYGLLFELKRK